MTKKSMEDRVTRTVASFFVAVSILFPVTVVVSILANFIFLDDGQMGSLILALSVIPVLLFRRQHRRLVSMVENFIKDNS